MINYNFFIKKYLKMSGFGYQVQVWHLKKLGFRYPAGTMQNTQYLIYDWILCILHLFSFVSIQLQNLTADDFGNYYLRAVNMLGKASASAVLMELPKEDIVVHRQTTNKPVSVNIDKFKLFDLDKAQVNKTDIILSKILNVKQQQKGVKEEDLDSDEYDDLDDSFYSSNKPFYFTKSDSANRTLYRNNPRIHLKSQSDYSQQDEDNTSTLKYHILQIGSSSLQIRSHLELTGFFLFASVSSLFQSNLLQRGLFSVFLFVWKISRFSFSIACKLCYNILSETTLVSARISEKKDQLTVNQVQGKVI